MKSFLLILGGLLILTLKSNSIYATTVTASVSGSWENGSTWVGGNVPQCGDSVLIGNGKIVQVTTVKDYSSCNSSLYISVAGTLNFQTGKKLILPCGSFLNLVTGGKITAGNGGGNSNFIDICSVVVWNAAQGTLNGPLTLPTNPLPIQLLHFAATTLDYEIDLIWVTASEVNNAYFVIEKSLDGKSFNEIGKLQGAGTTSTSKTYKLTDSKPVDGIQYYRLTQIDFDGAQKTFNLVGAKWSDQTDFRVYPNPSSSSIYADVATGLDKQTGTLIITKTDGTTVVSREISFYDKTKNVPLLRPSEKLKPGTYIVNIICHGILNSQQVVIQ